MSESKDLNPEGFEQSIRFDAKVIDPRFLKGIFEAYKEDVDEDKISIVDCRMTKTSSEGTPHGEAIKKQFDLPASTAIIALYLLGYEMSDNSNPPVSTAIGNCVFFIYNELDHGRLRQKNLIAIKKSAPLFYKRQDSNQYERSDFSQFANVSQNPEKLLYSSSPRSSHRRAHLNLFP